MFTYVFVAFLGCSYLDFYFVLWNFNTFGLLKYEKSIFLYEFQYFRMPAICPQLSFCMLILIFNDFDVDGFNMLIFT